MVSSASLRYCRNPGSKQQNQSKQSRLRNSLFRQQSRTNLLDLLTPQPLKPSVPKTHLLKEAVVRCQDHHRLKVSSKSSKRAPPFQQQTELGLRDVKGDLGTDPGAEGSVQPR